MSYGAAQSILDRAESKWRSFYAVRKPEPVRVYEPMSVVMAKITAAMARCNEANRVYRK